ncbi:MAG TPA: T9SS type A sorting domain-containing protein, partial [Candidatus Eisenbacteria bacterium]|nr:T9SS type A sorting domain-containing protein [Candidatus Eisenbacteria bacterium]
GVPWTEGQTLTAQSFADTVDVTAIVGDDVDIASIQAWNGTTLIPSSQITVTPPPSTQQGLQPYQVHLRTPLHLGSYSIRLEATDWAGVTSSLELPVLLGTSFQSDGRPLGEGETVDQAATIGILIDSPVPLTPGNFAVLVDSTAREDLVPTGGPTAWQINVPGPWTEGQHRVELRISDPNAVCVPACPLVRSLGFQAGGPPLDQVYFYPNPVEAEEGVFLYRLGENGHNAQVSIYSLTGRRIRRDDSPALAGLNSYRWDLRDEKGDRVANGVYLFVLRVEGQDGEVITNASAPEKVAITR